MSRKRRVLGSALKAKVALAAIRGDKTTAQLSSEFGVHATQVAAWKRRLLEGAPALFDDGRTLRRDAATPDEQELMRVLHGAADVDKQFEPVVVGEFMLVAELRDRQAVDQFHHEVGPAGVGDQRTEIRGRRTLLFLIRSDL
jgi:transposase